MYYKIAINCLALTLYINLALTLIDICSEISLFDIRGYQYFWEKKKTLNECIFTKVNVNKHFFFIWKSKIKE